MTKYEWIDVTVEAMMDGMPVAFPDSDSWNNCRDACEKIAETYYKYATPASLE